MEGLLTGFLLCFMFHRDVSKEIADCGFNVFFSVFPRTFREERLNHCLRYQRPSKQHQPSSLPHIREIHLNDLVYVRYLDHVLFKNSNHSSLSPVLRETVGFLTKQTNEAIWVLWDRSVMKTPEEQPSSESGLIILRSDIKEIRKI
jgi:hypothetical protein